MAKRTISALDDIPEDIVAEILYRLHIKPLFRFKCVSKLWNSIISGPKFSRNYLQRPRSSPKSGSPSDHLSAILYPCVDCDFNPPRNSDDDAPPSLYASSFYHPQGSRYHIEASSNGLTLGGLSPEAHLSEVREFKWEHKLCVSNPLTKRSVKLPILWLSLEPRWACGLATRRCENQDSITYKVVYIQAIRRGRRLPHHDNVIDFANVAIFSSDTGRWAHKERISWPSAVLYGDSSRAITYKGILHCFDWMSRTVVTYDPYESPDRLGIIPLPSRSGEKVMNSGFNLFRLGLEDLLEFAEIEECGDGGWKLCVWRLVDYDKREWRLEKSTPISPLLNEGLLSHCRLLFAPYPWNDDLICCCFANKIEVIVRDLASADAVYVNPFEIAGKSAFSISRYFDSVVPIALNPWSSPFHGEARRDSSSKPRFRNIIPAWFPSYSK